jgi:hypothetical protein
MTDDPREARDDGWLDALLRGGGEISDDGFSARVMRRIDSAQGSATPLEPAHALRLAQRGRAVERSRIRWSADGLAIGALGALAAAALAGPPALPESWPALGAWGAALLTAAGTVVLLALGDASA